MGITIRRLLMQAWVLFVVLPFGLPVNTRAASFDCRKAVTKTEEIICVDAGLSKLDEEMASFYRKTKDELHDASWFKDQQFLWLQHRNSCKDRSCIEASYRNRLDEMKWYLEIEKDPENTVVGKLPQDTYTYELDIDNNPTVCRHMKKVYNSYFRQPWATHRSDSKAYEDGGFYSYPKYPGVEEFVLSTWSVHHSRRPSSPEFDAVPWRSALRIDRSSPDAPPLSLCEKYRKEKKMSPEGTRCFYFLLIADFDIDNDGRVETVVKDSFMTGYPPLEHHSSDNYFIFPQGTIDPWQFAYGRGFLDRYDKFGSWPRTLPIEFMARPFILDDVIYLSSYHRWWKDDNQIIQEDPDREYMEVFKLNGSDEVTPKTQYSPAKYNMDLICRLKMNRNNRQ